MISLGEKVAIIIPSIFFNLILLMSQNDTASMRRKILDCLKPQPIVSDEKHVLNSVIQFIFNEFTTEFLFLMITNGLTMIFVLSESILGIVMIIIGVIITRYGSSTIQLEKTYLKISEKNVSGFDITEKVITIYVVLSLGNFGFFLFYDVTLPIPMNPMYFPWIAGLVFMIIGYIYSKYYSEKLLAFK